MQQPFEQYEPVGHVGFATVHVCSPIGHVFVFMQLDGSVLGSWPGHSTHV